LDLQLVLRHLRVLWRAERIIAETRLRITLRRTMLYALAGLVAVFGLGMLNVAAYFFLQSQWGAIWAALTAALGDVILAAALVGIALAIRPGPEMTAALELRDVSVDGLEAELAPLQERLAWFSRAARNPLDTLLPAILIPLITSIVRGLRKGQPS
jgi:hypothetical protein